MHLRRFLALLAPAASPLEHANRSIDISECACDVARQESDWLRCVPRGWPQVLGDLILDAVPRGCAVAAVYHDAPLRRACEGLVESNEEALSELFEAWLARGEPRDGEDGWNWNWEARRRHTRGSAEPAAAIRRESAAAAGVRSRGARRVPGASGAAAAGGLFGRRVGRGGAHVPQPTGASALPCSLVRSALTCRDAMRHAEAEA